MKFGFFALITALALFVALNSSTESIFGHRSEIYQTNEILVTEQV